MQRSAPRSRDLLLTEEIIIDNRRMLSSTIGPSSSDIRTVREWDASAHGHNVAAHLTRMAEHLPDHPAVIYTRSIDRSGRASYGEVSFAALESLCNRYANGLNQIGIGTGTRTLVMVRPGITFLALMFALFKMRAVPVLIDPGLGVNRMLSALRSATPEAFIGIGLAHVVRLLRRGAFESVKHVVTVGRRWAWGGHSLEGLAQRADDRYDPGSTAPEDEAAILFTSGATGPAKGVLYEHGMFAAQVRLIREYYGIAPGEVDLPCLPVFALFNPAMGMTSVIPDMNASRPAQVDPRNIVRAIRDHRVTNTFGSPAIWRRVAPWCLENGVQLSSLRRILIAGAPVPGRTIDQLLQSLSEEADVHTPYGATEALPVSSISGRTLQGALSDRARQGEGACVGAPFPETRVALIRVSDEPIGEWSDDLLVDDGGVGEVTVSSPAVTKSYFARGEATAFAKIADKGRTWHRMGDLARRDASGRLWFLGRKAHRVETTNKTYFPVCCEAIFNEHPAVARSALVGVNKGSDRAPGIVVESVSGRLPKGAEASRLRSELRELSRGNELTREIESILFRRALPVDVRHNAKIDREALSRWAQGRGE